MARQPCSATGAMVAAFAPPALEVTSATNATEAFWARRLTAAHVASASTTGTAQLIRSEVSNIFLFAAIKN